MHTIDSYTLHGIALRLVDAIPAGRGEALILARWIVSAFSIPLNLGLRRAALPV